MKRKWVYFTNKWSLCFCLLFTTVMFTSLEIEICHLNMKCRDFFQLLMKNFSIHAEPSSTSINILCFSPHLLLLCLMRQSVNRGVLRKKNGNCWKDRRVKIVICLNIRILEWGLEANLLHFLLDLKIQQWGVSLSYCEIQSRPRTLPLKIYHFDCCGPAIDFDFSPQTILSWFHPLTVGRVGASLTAVIFLRGHLFNTWVNPY